MGNLINEALSMGWMVLALLVGLLIYFQVSISDPAAKKRATFKTFIGIIAAFLMFIAIANYKNNFYGENRLLPVSLVMITATTFVMNPPIPRETYIYPVVIAFGVVLLEGWVLTRRANKKKGKTL